MTAHTRLEAALLGFAMAGHPAMPRPKDDECLFEKKVMASPLARAHMSQTNALVLARTLSRHSAVRRHVGLATPRGRNGSSPSVEEDLGGG